MIVESIFATNSSNTSDFKFEINNFTIGSFDKFMKNEEVLIFEMWFSTCPSPFPIYLIFPNVQKISFVGNRVENISLDTFERLTNLTSLVVIKTMIKWEIIQNDTFKDLLKLDRLHLRQNMIEVIEIEVFSNLRNLKKLSLNDNRLTSLPAGLFKSNTKLDQINLSNNRLKQIPVDLFDNLIKFQVNLENNCCINIILDILDQAKEALRLCSKEIIVNPSEKPKKTFFDNIWFRLCFGDWRF